MAYLRTAIVMPALRLLTSGAPLQHSDMNELLELGRFGTSCDFNIFDLSNTSVGVNIHAPALLRNDAAVSIAKDKLGGDVGTCIGSIIQDPKIFSKNVQVGSAKTLSGVGTAPFQMPLREVLMEDHALETGKDFVFDRQLLDDLPEIKSACAGAAHDLFGHYASASSPLIAAAGRQGTGIPFHYHTEAWSALLCGVKHWTVVPPKNMQPPGSVPGNGFNPSESHLFFIQRHSPGWANRSGVIQCVQQPGDIVFIPAGWYHATVTISNLTFAVARQDLPGTPRSDAQQGFFDFNVCSQLLDVETWDDAIATKAMKTCKSAAKLLPEQPLGRLKLGRAYLHTAEFRHQIGTLEFKSLVNKGLQQLRKGISLNPLDGLIVAYMNHTLRALGKSIEADQVCSSWLNATKLPDPVPKCISGNAENQTCRRFSCNTFQTC